MCSIRSYTQYNWNGRFLFDSILNCCVHWDHFKCFTAKYFLLPPYSNYHFSFPFKLTKKIYQLPTQLIKKENWMKWSFFPFFKLNVIRWYNCSAYDNLMLFQNPFDSPENCLKQEERQKLWNKKWWNEEKSNQQKANTKRHKKYNRNKTYLQQQQQKLLRHLILFFSCSTQHIRVFQHVH